MRASAGVLGAAAAAAYLAAVFVAGAMGVRVRPLYDGLAPPPPYRWIEPPEGAATRQRPQSARAEVALEPSGSVSRSLSTPDGQATIVLPAGAFAARDGEAAVRIAIDPVRPGTARLPPRLRIDGNTYRFSASSMPSGTPSGIVKPATIVLRYPVHSTTLVRLDKGSWRVLPTDVVAQGMQAFSDVTALGTFAAAGPPPAAQERGLPWAWAAAGAGLGTAAWAGWVVRRRVSRPGPHRRTG